MIVVKSKVSRSWPALGLTIQRGTNEFSEISSVHRALLSAYTSSGQMEIVEDKSAAERAPSKLLEDSVEAEAIAAKAGNSKTVLVKHTPPSEPKAETPKASKPKPVES